jgi:hypothetical protein
MSDYGDDTFDADDFDEVFRNVFAKNDAPTGETKSCGTVSRDTVLPTKKFRKERAPRAPRLPRKRKAGEWDSDLSENENADRGFRRRMANKRRLAKAEPVPVPFWLRKTERQRANDNERLADEGSVWCLPRRFPVASDWRSPRLVRADATVGEDVTETGTSHVINMGQLFAFMADWHDAK